ncbi:MAG: redoxin domain-containing protein [Candidatus Aminicenantes bacterium]|nr:redoxin domain-containing protein [Candidatus Aminicenantes bacterium]
MKKLVYLAAQLMIVMILFSQSSSPPVFAAPVFAGQQVTAPSSQKMPARIYSSIEEIADSSTQPILLVFFSLVCHVCWDELFEMKDFIEKFSLPVILIGISANETEELQAFASRYSFTYPLIQDRDNSLKLSWNHIGSYFITISWSMLMIICLTIKPGGIEPNNVY